MCLKYLQFQKHYDKWQSKKPQATKKTIDKNNKGMNKIINVKSDLWQKWQTGKAANNKWKSKKGNDKWLQRWMRTATNYKNDKLYLRHTTKNKTKNDLRQRHEKLIKEKVAHEKTDKSEN